MDFSKQDQSMFDSRQPYTDAPSRKEKLFKVQIDQKQAPITIKTSDPQLAHTQAQSSLISAHAHHRIKSAIFSIQERQRRENLHYYHQSLTDNAGRHKALAATKHLRQGPHAAADQV